MADGLAGVILSRTGALHPFTPTALSPGLGSFSSPSPGCRCVEIKFQPCKRLFHGQNETVSETVCCSTVPVSLSSKQTVNEGLFPQRNTDTLTQCCLIDQGHYFQPETPFKMLAMKSLLAVKSNPLQGIWGWIQCTGQHWKHLRGWGLRDCHRKWLRCRAPAWLPRDRAHIVLIWISLHRTETQRGRGLLHQHLHYLYYCTTPWLPLSPLLTEY